MFSFKDSLIRKIYWLFLTFLFCLHGWPLALSGGETEQGANLWGRGRQTQWNKHSPPPTLL